MADRIERTQIRQQSYLVFGRGGQTRTVDLLVPNQEVSLFCVYVLRNSEGRLYIGSTRDLARRLAEHAEGRAKWTAGRGPWELVYWEEFATRGAAMHRERELKGGRANQELRERLSLRKPAQAVERVLPGKD